MNTRERFEATFRFRTVDRPLLDYHGEPEVNGTVCRRLGVDGLDAALDALGVDFRTVAPAYVGPELSKGPGGEERDVWGIVRKPMANPTGVYMEPVGLPWAKMLTLDDVKAYPWPRPGWYDFSHFPGLCRQHGDRVIVFGRAGLVDLINGVAFGRGMAQVLMDIGTRDEVGLALFRKRFEFMFEFARCGLEAAKGKVDVLFFGEDLGTQQGLVISPAAWEKLFRPYMKQMIDLAHHYGARAMMHSCGSVTGLIPRFIDLGLDALQAVQPRAAGMEPGILAREFGGKIVFDGTMDIQQTLPFGTVEDVRGEVRYRKRVFAEHGGFILGPCHKIQTDTPVENILAMYEEGGKTE